MTHEEWKAAMEENQLALIKAHVQLTNQQFVTEKKLEKLQDTVTAFGKTVEKLAGSVAEYVATAHVLTAHVDEFITSANAQTARINALIELFITGKQNGGKKP